MSGPACLVVPAGAALFLLIAFLLGPKPQELREEPTERRMGLGWIPASAQPLAPL